MLNTGLTAFICLLFIFEINMIIIIIQQKYKMKEFTNEIKDSFYLPKLYSVIPKHCRFWSKFFKEKFFWEHFGMVCALDQAVYKK
jgi:hypothetical protein